MTKESRAPVDSPIHFFNMTSSLPSSTLVITDERFGGSLPRGPVSRQFSGVDEDLGKVDELRPSAVSSSDLLPIVPSRKIFGHLRSGLVHRRPARNPDPASRGDLIKFGGHSNHDVTTTRSDR